MMRPIKFRAFGGATNEHPAFMINDITDWAVGDLNSASWKIMQFTGLHDKNGKEICEGDVVKTSEYIGGNFVDSIYTRGKIEVYKTSFRLLQPNNMFRYLNQLIDDDVSLEVLGNIYENPDLLK